MDVVVSSFAKIVMSNCLQNKREFVLDAEHQPHLLFLPQVMWITMGGMLDNGIIYIQEQDQL
jgi:hypothetical protein